MMSESQNDEQKLQQTLKLTLEQCITLARKKIRSKKGLTDLQALLTDYRSNTQLSIIIYEVIKLISIYQTNKKDETDQARDTVTIQQYTNLQSVLQKYQASVRQHIKNQQQLKIYCEDLEQKNRQLQKNNQQLLKNTKQMITNLKRQNQTLLQQNSKYKQKIKQNDKKQREGSVRDSRERQQSIINSIKKARKLIQSQNSHTGREQTPIQPWGQRAQDSMKVKRHSLTSIKQNK